MPLRRYAGPEIERTRPHRKVEKMLESVGINYLSEEGFPPYAVDIYLLEWHLAIEIDGPMHSPNKDKTKDEHLQLLYRLPVFRIRISESMKKDTIIARITKFIEANCEDVEERKLVWQTQR